MQMHGKIYLGAFHSCIHSTCGLVFLVGFSRIREEFICCICVAMLEYLNQLNDYQRPPVVAPDRRCDLCGITEPPGLWLHHQQRQERWQAGGDPSPGAASHRQTGLDEDVEHDLPLCVRPEDSYVPSTTSESGFVTRDGSPFSSSLRSTSPYSGLHFTPLPSLDAPYSLNDELPCYDSSRSSDNGDGASDARRSSWLSATFACDSEPMQRREGLTVPAASGRISADRRSGLWYCDLCSFSSKFNSSMRTHMRTHTNERPFSCCFCEMRFKQRSHLSRHLRTHDTPYNPPTQGSNSLQAMSLPVTPRSLSDLAASM